MKLKRIIKMRKNKPLIFFTVCVLVVFLEYSFAKTIEKDVNKTGGSKVINLIPEHEKMLFEGSMIQLISKSENTYTYQFRLRKYQDNEYYLAKNTPYFLKIEGYDFKQESGETSYVGVTNDLGETVQITLKNQLEEDGVNLVEHYGDRNIGNVFRITDQRENPLINQEYTITLDCPNDPLVKFYGETNHLGFTMHIGTKISCEAKLYEGFNKDL